MAEGSGRRGDRETKEMRSEATAIPITIVLGAFLRPPPGPTGAVEKIWTRLAEVLVGSDARFAISIVHRSSDGPPAFLSGG